MNKKNIGLAYEEMAVKFLMSEGYEIIDRNYSLKDAEIDIISKKKLEIPCLGLVEYIVFTEVKYRKTTKYGNPYEAVDNAKQRKICKAAIKYISDHKLSVDTAVRFDIISIVDDKIKLIENAFDYVS